MNETELRNAMRAHGDTVYRLALCRMQNTGMEPLRIPD